MDCGCYGVRKQSSCPNPVPPNESLECAAKREEINTAIFFTDMGERIFFVNQLVSSEEAQSLCPSLDAGSHLINQEDLNNQGIIKTLKRALTVDGTPCSVVIWASINGNPKLVSLFGKKCIRINECLSVCNDVDVEILRTPSVNCPAFVVCVAPF
ncbi:hypothetical protein ACSVDE_00220 [Pseudalkalibacillus sp. Hm43]|uniref:hypothetical protein n=1 Tax=Pseudalkalibacillus sp. Hm43 TaxID=3450742 RepID=UPI003F420995